MESIITAIVGVVCIVIGFLNRKGNISMLHSYHIKRVSEEDKLPFGKLVGLGMIIIGISIIIMGGLMLATRITEDSAYALAGTIISIVGMAIGFVITFYAMFKYNKGIF